MRITILTLFPEIFTGFINTSIIKNAINKELITVNIVDFRKWSKDKFHHVDDTPFGGGAGMILSCQPIIDCLKDNSSVNSHVILTSPIGEPFSQAIASDLVSKEDIVIICGHYEGFDERISDYVDQKISIGDYVLTGGELPAMVITDAVSRLVKDVICQESLVDESFTNGLLEYPQYTKPQLYDNKAVPEVLISGHHENIRKYRLYESLKRTYLLRRDLLENRQLTKEEAEMLDKIVKEHQDVNK